MKLQTDTPLPKGFESVERFVDDWALDTTTVRLAKRYTSDLADITEFYDAMRPIAVGALDYLRHYQLGAIPPEGQRLMRLMLMLQEVAPAVEWYGDPIGTDCYDYRRVKIAVEIPDVAAQA